MYTAIITMEKNVFKINTSLGPLANLYTGGLCVPREMVECFNQLSTDPECRVVVLTGAGPVFTAG